MAKSKLEYHTDLCNRFPELEFLSNYTIRKNPISVKYPCGCVLSVNIGKLIDRGDGSKCKKHTTIKSAKTHDKFIEEVATLSTNIDVLSQYTKAKDKVDILYKDCGHTHRIEANSLLMGNSIKCRICNTGAKQTDTYIEQLRKVNNKVKLVSEYVNSTTKVTVRYEDCGHEHSAEPNTFLKGVSCECNICKTHKTTESFKEEMLQVNSELEIVGQYTHSKENIEYKFKSCGHTAYGTPSNLLQFRSGVKCLVCTPLPYGLLEQELYDYVSSIYSGWIERNDRYILNGKELDIVLPDLGIALEFNGIYWHSSIFKDSKYHMNKTNNVADFGYKLIHIYEDDWVNKKEIVKSRLNYIITKNSARIYARKCSIREIPWAEASEFINSSHIQGAGAATKINIGLFDGDELVAIQTFGKPKVVSDQEYELVRYCSKLGSNVIGGASKLLKYFVNTYSPKGIISYSDRTWSTGELYKTLGFKYSHTTNPGYCYYKGLEAVSRYKFQKAKLKELFPNIYEDSKTEFEIMKEAGYLRVHDSGNDVWIV